MAVRKLAGACDGKTTCPGVWTDDQYPEDVIFVGENLAPSPVELGAGEKAIRLSRKLLAEAGLGENPWT